MDDAVATAKETCQCFPENQFAEIAFVKLCFLSGNQGDVDPLIESIAKMVPNHQDAFVAQCELLAMLGRDDELLALCESVDKDLLADPHCEACRLHFAAYAHHRSGNIEKAEAYRDEYAKQEFRLPDAEDNLDDLESGKGHAPWASALGYWLPSAAVGQMADQQDRICNSSHPLFAVLSGLTPALLDRGDPSGRSFALGFAMMVGSEPMLEALRSFAFGQSGPDDQRSSALMYLNTNGHLEPGPLRIFSGGKWREIQLLSAQIYWEPADVDDSPEIAELYEEGHEAMVNGQFDHAEECFNAVIEKDKTHLPALYNRCAAWIQRDGKKGKAKAKPELEKLRQDFPDYVFARTALVNYLLDDGKVAEAKELLAPVYKSDRLHFTEARALFYTQAAISNHEDDWAGIQRAVDALTRLDGEDDPHVMQWRQIIGVKKQLALLDGNKPLKRLLDL